MSIEQPPPSRTKTRLAILLVVAALALLVASVRHSVVDDTGFTVIATKNAQPAPDFTLTDSLSGRTVHLREEAKKQPVVFSFWATWCGPCRAEMPVLQTLSEKYKGRILLCGVNSSDSPAAMRQYARQMNITFPMLGDPTMETSTKYAVEAIPKLVIVDQQGKLRLIVSGYSPDEQEKLPKLLDEILSGS